MKRLITVACWIALAACTQEASDDRTPEPTARASGSVVIPTPRESTPSPSAPAGCRNSRTPSCGAFRFDPPVDDDPVRVTVDMSTRTPRVGEEVVFTLRATDPDSLEVAVGTYRFSRDEPGLVVDDFPDECRRAYGPWDPPPTEPTTFTKTLRHTYRTPGKKEALFSFFSHGYRDDETWPGGMPGDADGFCIDPYASFGKAEVALDVRG